MDCYRADFVFSGYDFGYMIRILQGGDLPEDEEEFFNVVKIYFSKIYDVKYLMKSCKTLKGGLQEVADQLEVIQCVKLKSRQMVLVLSFAVLLQWRSLKQ